MNSIRYSLAFFVISLISISLNSCGTSSAYRNYESLSPMPTPTPISSQVMPPDSARVKPNVITPKKPFESAAIAAEMVTVTIYQIDDTCQSLIPAKVSLPKETSLEAAIVKILDQQNTADLNLAYRLKVDPANNIVTIDLRIVGRPINSLSLCEQMAVFGSLRKTLLSNPLWNIKTVRFTQQGEEIAL